VQNKLPLFKVCFSLNKNNRKQTEQQTLLIFKTNRKFVFRGLLRCKTNLITFLAWLLLCIEGIYYEAIQKFDYLKDAYEVLIRWGNPMVVVKDAV
jgi:hypothetical protein